MLVNTSHFYAAQVHANVALLDATAALVNDSYGGFRRRCSSASATGSSAASSSSSSSPSAAAPAAAAAEGDGVSGAAAVAEALECCNALFQLPSDLGKGAIDDASKAWFAACYVCVFSLSLGSAREL